jgi:hypothetical protein
MADAATETASEAQTNGTSNAVWTAPYTSFPTVITTSDRMKEQGGVPSRVDRSYLSKLPGGAQTIFQSSLKSLGLIDEHLAPTPQFEAFVDASPVDRKRIVGELVREYYVGPMALGERATQQQLEDEFRKLNVTGSTMRKAVGFFLNAAKYAGIPVSPNFKLPKAPASTGPRKPRKGAAARASEEQQQEEEDLTPKMGLPTLVQGLVERLPKDGEEWTSEEAEQWLNIAKLTFPFVYGFELATEKTGGGGGG